MIEYTFKKLFCVMKWEGSMASFCRMTLYSMSQEKSHAVSALLFGLNQLVFFSLEQISFSLERMMENLWFPPCIFGRHILENAEWTCQVKPLTLFVVDDKILENQIFGRLVPPQQELGSISVPRLFLRRLVVTLINVTFKILYNKLFHEFHEPIFSKWLMQDAPESCLSERSTQRSKRPKGFM